MKKIFLFLIISMTLTSFNKPSDPKLEFDIIGAWKSEGLINYGKFIFDKEGFAFIDFNNDPVGGKKYKKKGMTFSLEYAVDYKKEPKHLDLIFTNFESGNKMIMHCIFEVITDNKINFARGENNEPRPNEFNSSNSITLERMK